MPIADRPGGRMHPFSLLVAVALMLGGSVYPLLMANAQGQADHRLALLWLWAMSAGFVHGVGFVPRARVWRVLLSAGTMALALVGALALRYGAHA